VDALLGPDGWGVEKDVGSVTFEAAASSRSKEEGSGCGSGGQRRGRLVRGEAQVLRGVCARVCVCSRGTARPGQGGHTVQGIDLTWLALFLRHPFTFVVSELSFSPEVESPASLATARDAAPDRVVADDDVRLRNDTPERPVAACREAAMLAKRWVVAFCARPFFELLFTSPRM